MTIHLLTMAKIAKSCPKISMSLFVKEMVIFADVRYFIYTDMVDEWVRKSPKIYWHNIGMVPLQSHPKSGVLASFWPINVYFKAETDIFLTSITWSLEFIIALTTKCRIVLSCNAYYQLGNQLFVKRLQYIRIQNPLPKQSEKPSMRL